jgi:hypothetical protein
MLLAQKMLEKKVWQPIGVAGLPVLLAVYFFIAHAHARSECWA